MGIELTTLVAIETNCIFQGRRGRDHMVVVFTTTYAISAYHHRCCEFESRSGRGVQYYVIKFVSDLRQVDGFLMVLRFPTSIKLTAMIKLLLKVALNTIKQTNHPITATAAPVI